MDLLSKFFYPSDWIVEKIHGLTKIPWEEINSLIPFGLPNEGLGFPIMLGRIVYIGVLAGILIILINRRRRFQLWGREKKFDPMSVYTIPVVVCLWVEFLIIRDFFFEKDLFTIKYTSELPHNIGMLFHGESTLQSNLNILMGIVVIIIALLALILPLILPAIYFGSMKEYYGKMTPLYFLLRASLYTAGVSLFALALYVAVKSGFAGKAFTLALTLALGSVLLYFVVIFGLGLLNSIIFSIFRLITPSAWVQSIKRAEEDYKKYGERYAIEVKDLNGNKTVYKGKSAVNFIKNNYSKFHDIPDDPLDINYVDHWDDSD